MELYRNPNEITEMESINLDRCIYTARSNGYSRNEALLCGGKLHCPDCPFGCK